MRNPLWGYLILRCTRYAAKPHFMEKTSIKSMAALHEEAGSSGSDVGYLVPRKSQFCGTPDSSFATEDGYMVPSRSRARFQTYLDGNFARRKLPVRARDYCIWDTHLAGFGMRVRSSGKRIWFVRLRERGKQRRIALGEVEVVEAHVARIAARQKLAAASLDGLPRRATRKCAPLLSDFYDEFWRDCARNWKPSTQKRNHSAWVNYILPCFEDSRVDAISKVDVTHWRDGLAGSREAIFNRTIPVFSAIMGHAELLGYRKKGSNPCRGMKRYKRAAKERFLSPAEYRRLGAALAEAEAKHPLNVAIVRLLLLTGARYSEIASLEWGWIKPPRLVLPDSKEGPKTIWLCSQALEILSAIPRRDGCEWVFPSPTGKRAHRIDDWWIAFRRKCGLVDVRIHDLRHSYASAAIMANVPLPSVGRLLGHKHPESTARYTHLADDVVADAAARVSDDLAMKLGIAA